MVTKFVGFYSFFLNFEKVPMVPTTTFCSLLSEGDFFFFVLLDYYNFQRKKKHFKIKFKIKKGRKLTVIFNVSYSLYVKCTMETH